ncbi:MAG TPA: glycosyltransferase family 9 protein [Sneathiellales bacterium]|nr:glycosyltransferase family 9 protein [Sneathiellales bacterium]
MSDPSATEHILVIKLSALGDFVQALGPMKAIRDHHARAQITLLTTTAFADLGQATGWFDQIWIDRRPGVFNLPGWRSLRCRLSGANFDRVYDLQTSSRSSFYYRAMFGHKPEWSGVAAGCSHPHVNPRRDFDHTIDRQREQLECAGIDAVPAPSLGWANADLTKFDLRDRIGLLVPGGAAHRPAKRWPASGYGEIANRMNSAGIHPLVIGAPGEEILSQEIGRICPASLNLIGRTSLVELAALAQRAEVAIGNDTGPMHMAATAGCRTVVLFSADSDPSLCAPRGTQVTVLREDKLTDLSVAKVANVLNI